MPVASGGLSLCIQGTSKHKSVDLHQMRFIPVYTGNISITNFEALSAPVYPCVYREHSSFLQKRQLNVGLSLCIQGTYRLKVANCVGRRFIPVYTGNMLASTGFSLAPSVYPCVYREHVYRTDQNTAGAGLSLCIQGTS